MGMCTLQRIFPLFFLVTNGVKEEGSGEGGGSWGAGEIIRMVTGNDWG